MEINCKGIANEILNNAYRLANMCVGTPRLAIIQVGDDKASNTYIRNKMKKCKLVGIEVDLHKFDDFETMSLLNGKLFNEVAELIDELNNDDRVTSIMLQLPTVFSDRKEQQLIDMIKQEKDVDGLGKSSKYQIYVENNRDALPCTSLGVLEVMRRWNDMHGRNTFEGLNVLLIGRTDLINKPLIPELISLDATVSVAHSKTEPQKLNELIKSADVIVSSAPKAHMFTSKEINELRSGNCSENRLYIDVTTAPDEKGKLAGSLKITDEPNFYYTPVPRGVGQLTTSMLCYKVAVAKLNKEDILDGRN